MTAVNVVIDNEEFVTTYQPIKNNIPGANGGWDGCFFETFGEELEFVRKVHAITPEKVWTILDVDGELIVDSGFHFVNRFGYIITEVPCPIGVYISVQDPEDDADLDA